MAEGGWSSGAWGEAGWGMSVYDRDAAETATASDLEAVAGSVFNSAIVEVGEIVDNIATVPTYFSGTENNIFVGGVALVASSTLGVSVSETSAISSANSAQQIFDCDTQDAAAISDSTAAQQQYASAVSESATGSDALDPSFVYFSDANETVVASDSPDVEHVKFVSVDETATGADAVSASHNLVTSVSERAVASVNTAVAASIFYAYLVAEARIADSPFARFLWEPVDDNQDANWQNINDAQSAGWAQVGTIQSPDWQQVIT
jgi:hypothetical protein